VIDGRMNDMAQMEFSPDFGKRIRELRHREGKMSLRELARRTDISPSYLSQIERGKLPPPTKNILLIIMLAYQLNEDPLELAKLARRPVHSLAEILSDHPELLIHITATFQAVEEKSIDPELVFISLQVIAGDLYGKLIGKPDQEELSKLTDQVIEAYRFLKEKRWKH